MSDSLFASFDADPRVENQPSIRLRASSINGGRNYVIAVGNRIAQIVVPAVNGAAIDGDTGTGDFTSTDPWANFSY